MNRRRFLKVLSTAIIGLGFQPITAGLVNSEQQHVRCRYHRSGYLQASEFLSAEYLLIGEPRLPEVLFVTRAVGGNELWVYSANHWSQIVQNLSNCDYDTKLKDSIFRYLVASAWETSTKNGRMVLPEYLRGNVQFQQEDLVLRFDNGKGALTLS